MSQIPREKMQQQFKIINYMGLAMIGTLYIYAAVVLAIDLGYIPSITPRPLESGILTKLKYILLFISMMFYIIMWFVKKSTLKKSTITFIKGTLVIWALCEAVGIYGLVLFILGHNSTDFFIFMALSLLYFFVFYPRYADFERLWSQASSAAPSD